MKTIEKKARIQDAAEIGFDSILSMVCVNFFTTHSSGAVDFTTLFPIRIW